MPGVVVAEDTANGDGMSTSRFLLLQMVESGLFPRFFLPKMALGNSENQKTEAYY